MKYENFIDKYAICEIDDNLIDEKEKQEVTKYMMMIQFIVFEALTYLKHKKLINLPNNIKIKRYCGDIIINNLYQDKVISTLRIRIKKRYKYLRIFTVQTLNNKGRLSEEETVAFYTSNYKKAEGIPPKPNNNQINVLTSTYKKISNTLTPLNNDALEKAKEEEENIKNKRR